MQGYNGQDFDAKVIGGQGLSCEAVLASRREHGENVLTPPPRTPAWRLLLNKFSDPMIVILLVALGLSVVAALYQAVSGEAASLATALIEPVGILIAILLATTIGFIFEQSANRKFEVLNTHSDNTVVKVTREGIISEIPRREVVVGDWVMLESGEEIPADGELLKSVMLLVDESTLTGEPSCRKSDKPEHFDHEATYPTNHVLRGTRVLEGHGVVRVLRVGDHTEAGKVFKGATIDNSLVTPLNAQLERLATLIARISYGLAVLIIVGRLGWWWAAQPSGVPLAWSAFFSYALGTIMLAVTVVVVAVPEGLPMSVTLSLALSMKRMLSANNLVRKMHACETMGATTVICTDKTGTLTQNRMELAEIHLYESGLERSSATLTDECFAINSTAWLGLDDPKHIAVIGNPTEGALLLWLHRRGVDYWQMREASTIVAQLPFNTERKYMVTVVESDGGKGERILYVKGASEILLRKCAVLPEAQEQIMKRLLGYQQKAMRTLGFGCQIVPAGEPLPLRNGELDTQELVFLGVVGIADPLRSNVPAAVRESVAAGIKIKIITGDTARTALEIGRQIGLCGDDEPAESFISGPEFGALTDVEAAQRIKQLKIMSRARPMDKKRLVELLQQQGEVVAVTGDGTNDAPALNVAHVGLSMGDGTAVAKEASDITILDDSFATITQAVLWGRSLYRNIQRFLLFQLSINVVACTVVVVGAFSGTEAPLTVTQMLWVNLIMDTLAALALASLPPEGRVMHEKPRHRDASIITRRMSGHIVGQGITFVVLLFGLLQMLRHESITRLSELSVSGFFANFFRFTGGDGLSAYELTLFFTIFVLMQFWNMFNARAFMTGRSALWGLWRNVAFLQVALLILGGQWLIVTFGGAMFSVVPLGWQEWLTIIVGTSWVLWLSEVVRFGSATLKARCRLGGKRAGLLLH